MEDEVFGENHSFKTKQKHSLEVKLLFNACTKLNCVEERTQQSVIQECPFLCSTKLQHTDTIPFNHYCAPPDTAEYQNQSDTVRTRSAKRDPNWPAFPNRCTANHHHRRSTRSNFLRTQSLEFLRHNRQSPYPDGNPIHTESSYLP
mmetsp:Transcript_265/g.306  ORF Transcript_265/g.306 Transcript_265/m.306 type:complete len:146 (+) Transcript_265:5-442(+)